MRSVEYDSKFRLATFTGPGGFTQAVITKAQARAIANALGIAFFEKS